MPDATDCEPCRHEAEHGWWGIKGTHCRRCHRTWIGYTECHCASCCLHFGSVAAFDAHFRRDECGTPPLTTKTGRPAFKLIDRASGPVWVSDAGPEAAEKFRLLRQSRGKPPGKGIHHR